MDAQRLSGVSFSFDISIKLSRETDVDDDDVASKIYSSNTNHKIYYNVRISNFRIVKTSKISSFKRDVEIVHSSVRPKQSNEWIGHGCNF